MSVYKTVNMLICRKFNSISFLETLIQYIIPYECIVKLINSYRECSKLVSDITIDDNCQIINRNDKCTFKDYKEFFIKHDNGDWRLTISKENNKIRFYSITMKEYTFKKIIIPLINMNKISKDIYEMELLKNLFRIM